MTHNVKHWRCGKIAKLGCLRTLKNRGCDFSFNRKIAKIFKNYTLALLQSNSERKMILWGKLRKFGQKGKNDRFLVNFSEYKISKNAVLHGLRHFSYGCGVESR